jgi:class 3 adenylate cyclase
VEFMGVDVIGVAVHIAARVRALAEGGEVLTTSAVRDLAPDIKFAARGSHELKGVPGEWLLLAAT